MKKAVVYTVLSAIVVFTAGCGMADAEERLPSASPVISAAPNMTTPDVGNGVVNDRDGVITPGDNGIPTTTAPTSNPGMLSPSSSPSATPNM